MAKIQSSAKYNELIKLTSNGIRIATSTEVKDAFTTLYKDIFGYDVDLSTGTSDDQHIHQFVLIYNNLLQSIKDLSNNYYSYTASSHYLDIIYALRNKKRQSASKSTCYCYAKYTGIDNSTASSTFSDDGHYANLSGDNLTQSIEFVDRSYNKWKWSLTVTETSQLIRFESGKIYLLKFECENSGTISLLSNTISRDEYGDLDLNDDNHGEIASVVNDETIHLALWLKGDAKIGSTKESDQEFRLRVTREDRATNTNVLENLLYTLSSYEGIDDVKIYAPSNADAKALDTTPYNSRCYICVRYSEDFEVADYEIGKLIYNNLTPGIITCAPLDSETNPNTRKIQINVYNNIIKQKIYWKKCPIQPVYLSITFITVEDYFNEDKTKPLIVSTIKEYMKGLTFDDYFISSNLINDINSIDTVVDGSNSFITISCLIGTTSSEITNDYMELPDAYFNVDDYNFVWANDSTDESTLYLTVSPKTSS